MKTLKTMVVTFALLLASTAQAYAITLSWNDNSNNEDGFKVERAANATAPFAQIAQVGANVTTYVDSAGAPGNCYRVKAYNIAGDSGYTNVACVPTLPADPSGLKLSLSFSGSFQNNKLTAQSPDGFVLVGVVRNRRFSGTVSR